MADILEGTPNESQTPQDPTVQESETPSQGNVAEGEENPQVVLPSDVEEFTMPEKFEGKSVEEIAKAYVNLEKMRNETPSVETPPAETPTPEQEGEVNYLQEYFTNGEVSEETYIALAEKGMTKADVDDRIEFETYKRDKQVNELVEPIGGIDAYNALNEWVKESMTPAKVEEYAAALREGTVLSKQAILKDLYSQYNVAVNDGTVAPQFIHTNENQSPNVRGYASELELRADMADKRYGNDRLYTEAVEKKLAASKL